MSNTNKNTIKPAVTKPADPVQTARLHPFCRRCGWRKGGRDSWDGEACRCGEYEGPARMPARLSS